MALIDNRVTNVGDVIYIKADKPVVGLVALTDFQDLVVNEGNPSEFDKEFRYSFDGGITWSSWMDLTDSNIQSVPVRPTADFEAEFKYTKTYDGDGDGQPEIYNITLDAEYQPESCGFTYVNSIFNQFFGCHDVDVLDWCINVTEKLYKSGIVPRYLIRDEEIGFDIDRDYIDFWRTIACFFAYIVVFSRTLTDFASQEMLLRRFLSERAVNYCSQDTLSELQYILNNYYDEIRKRGTRQIYKQYDNINGELLRLICYNEMCNEFLFDLSENRNIGWNIGNSSPLFKGVHQHLNLNKSYEYSEDFVDLSLYPIINDSQVSISTDRSKEVMDITGVSSGTDAGIGDDSEVEKYIIVNPYINYEITFYVKQPVLGDSLTFECYSYDKNGNQITLLSNQDGSDSNTFFQFRSLNIPDKYYFVRGIIYNVDRSNEPDQTTNLKAGQQLRFKNNEVCQILPRIYLNDSAGTDEQIYLWDLKIKPSSVNFSKGFLNSPNFIINFVQYNNDSLSKENFEETVRKYLIPYNAIYKPQYLEQDFIDQSTIGSFNNDYNSDFG